jgi:hypothetical protein
MAVLVPLVLNSRGRTPKGCVIDSFDVVDERMETRGRVGAADVVLERSITNGRAAGAVNVAKQGECSNGRASLAGGVVEKRPGANGRIFVCGVRQEHPGANTSVEVGLAVA